MRARTRRTEGSWENQVMGGSSTADETNKQQDVLAPTDTDAQRLPVELQHIISGTNLTSDWPFAYQWAFGSTTGALPARRVLRASDGTALVGPIEV